MFDRQLVWQIEQQLDVDAMKTAAKYLVGTYDFAAFTSAKNKKKSTVRSIESILFEQNGADIRISFRETDFLFHMIRILTGTLVEVGLGCADRKKLLRFWTEKTGRRRECWHRRPDFA